MQLTPSPRGAGCEANPAAHRYHRGGADERPDGDRSFRIHSRREREPLRRTAVCIDSVADVDAAPRGTPGRNRRSGMTSVTRELTPARLWVSLPAEIRVLAARSWDWKSPETRREADLAIARSLNFREAFVRKLPLEKRIGYLASAVRADDQLASTLLVALHLEHRRP